LFNGPRKINVIRSSRLRYVVGTRGMKKRRNSIKQDIKEILVVTVDGEDRRRHGYKTLMRI
jgi:hypothetical protein